MTEIRDSFYDLDRRFKEQLEQYAQCGGPEVTTLSNSSDDESDSSSGQFSELVVPRPSSSPSNVKECESKKQSPFLDNDEDDNLPDRRASSEVKRPGRGKSKKSRCTENDPNGDAEDDNPKPRSSASGVGSKSRSPNSRKKKVDELGKGSEHRTRKTTNREAKPTGNGQEEDKAKEKRREGLERPSRHTKRPSQTSRKKADQSSSGGPKPGGRPKQAREESQEVREAVLHKERKPPERSASSRISSKERKLPERSASCANVKRPTKIAPIESLENEKTGSGTGSREARALRQRSRRNLTEGSPPPRVSSSRADKSASPELEEEEFEEAVKRESSRRAKKGSSEEGRTSGGPITRSDSKRKVNKDGGAPSHQKLSRSGSKRKMKNDGDEDEVGKKSSDSGCSRRTARSVEPGSGHPSSSGQDRESRKGLQPPQLVRASSDKPPNRSSLGQDRESRKGLQPPQLVRASSDKPPKEQLKNDRHGRSLSRPRRTSRRNLMAGLDTDGEPIGEPVRTASLRNLFAGLEAEDDKTNLPKNGNDDNGTALRAGDNEDEVGKKPLGSGSHHRPSNGQDRGKGENKRPGLSQPRRLSRRNLMQGMEADGKPIKKRGSSRNLFAGGDGVGEDDRTKHHKNGKFDEPTLTRRVSDPIGNDEALPVPPSLSRGSSGGGRGRMGGLTRRSSSRRLLLSNNNTSRRCLMAGADTDGEPIKRSSRQCRHKRNIMQEQNAALVYRLNGEDDDGKDDVDEEEKEQAALDTESTEAFKQADMEDAEVADEPEEQQLAPKKQKKSVLSLASSGAKKATSGAKKASKWVGKKAVTTTVNTTKAAKTAVNSTAAAVSGSVSKMTQHTNHAEALGSMDDLASLEFSPEGASMDSETARQTVAKLA